MPSEPISPMDAEHNAQMPVDIALKDCVSRFELRPFAVAAPAFLEAKVQNKLTSEYNDHSLENVKQHLSNSTAPTRSTAADPSPEPDFRLPIHAPVWSLGSTPE